MEYRPIKLWAMMTAPRYEAVSTRNVIQEVLRSMNIPLSVSGGVFYGQCMQRMLIDGIGKGADIALTIDGDSVFGPDHINRLLYVMANRPDIDALAPLQVRRGMRFPLMSVSPVNLTPGEPCEHGGTGFLETDGDPIRVETAHFGLTMIRLDRLREIPRPWFYSKPDRNGDWENDKVDDDIWFWKVWENNKRTIYVDPQCRIGHMEEMVAGFDDEGRIKHYYMRDWVRNNCKIRVTDGLGCADVSNAAEAVAVSSGGNGVGFDAGTDRVACATGDCCGVAK